MGFIAAFGISGLLVFAGTVVVALWRRRSLSDAAIDALNASYPNTGFMGFPLVLAVFGTSALPLALIASIITVCVLFGLAIVLIEIARQADRDLQRLIQKLAASLIKNPLIIAPAAAGLVAWIYGDLPAPIEVFLKLLSAAASPCALVALGLFIAEKRRARERREEAAACALAATKLLVQPAMAYGIAVALRLPSSTTAAAVLLAALPTGTGPFMLAELYRCEASVTARTILLTTFISIFTIALCIRALV